VPSLRQIAIVCYRVSFLHDRAPRGQQIRSAQLPRFADAAGSEGTGNTGESGKPFRSGRPGWIITVPISPWQGISAYARLEEAEGPARKALIGSYR
jgi:hypothetical protein